MDTGPFPVDKRGAQPVLSLENAESALPESETTLSAVARAGVVTARERQPTRPIAKNHGLKVLPRSAASEAAEDEGLAAPERNYDCPNYETCLGLAAALDWKSFTCTGCCGQVNQQLLWRAHHRIRNNPSLSQLCNLPELSNQ